MRPCPNCGQPVAEGKAVCPNCGASVPAIWPPPPAGAPPPAPPVRFLTGRRGSDITLGIIIGVVSPLAWGYASSLLLSLGFYLHLPFGLFGGYAAFAVAALGLYLWTRPRYPVFARSLGWTFLAEITLVLGAVALCLVALSGNHSSFD